MKPKVNLEKIQKESKERHALVIKKKLEEKEAKKRLQREGYTIKWNAIRKANRQARPPKPEREIPVKLTGFIKVEQPATVPEKKYDNAFDDRPISHPRHKGQYSNRNAIDDYL